MKDTDDAFTPEDLIACYQRGVFPMADSRDDEGVFLIDPQRRGVLPLDGFQLSSRLARTVRSGRFDVHVDTAFARVVDLCAQGAPGREDTWINPTIEALYSELHRRGLAHSVETWREGRLVGGLYGVSLGGAFFGESMFSRATDASKVALVHLVARLRVGGYRLLDCQFVTDHLTQFGVVEIPRAEYHRRLAQALEVDADFGRFEDGPQAALQAISQAS
ncbi:MAG: leucyl/phenylalanyl-tRNA--protein transferase [Caulobacter sp.]|nr:leucyl/phenylalanyl-tRNA--protein transferase [Caulobacter sp.]